MKREICLLALCCSLNQVLGKTGPAYLTWSPLVTGSHTEWMRRRLWMLRAFSKAKCCTCLMTTQSCLVRKDLGVLVTSSWAWARGYLGGQVPNWSPFISNSVPSRNREVVTPLYLALVGLHSKSYIRFWVPLCKKGVEKLKHVHRRVTKLVRSKSLMRRSWGSWRKLRLGGTFSLCLQLAERRVRGQVGVSLFSQVTSGRTRANGLKLCQGSFRLDTRKNIFTKTWNIGTDWWCLRHNFGNLKTV